MEQDVKRKNNTNIDDNKAKSIGKRPTSKRGRRKKNNPIIPILCLVIGILIGILGTIMFTNKDDAENYKDKTQTETKEESDDLRKEMLEKESFKIETPYIDLYYVKEWENKVRIEHIDGESYSVQFFARLDGKEEVHIFDIVFDSEEGSVLGYIEQNDEESISVNVISYDFEIDENWSDEEINEVYSMLDDINYTIGMIQKEEGFIPVS